MRKINSQTNRVLAPICAACKERGIDIIEFLACEYHDKKLSIAEIASEWSVNTITLNQFFRRHQIPRRSKSESAKLGQRKRFDQQREAKQKGHMLPKTREALMPIFDHCEENGLDIVEFIRAEYWDKKKTLLGMSKEWDVERITLTRFMDDYGIPRRTRSETQSMVAEDPSEKQAAQRQEWKETGWRWARTEEGREFRRQATMNHIPSRQPGAAEKISKAKMGAGNWMYGRRGPRCPNWTGGARTYSPEFTRLREFIRARDDYTCQLCGESPSADVHHIDYDVDNNNVLNLITLCRKCHMKTNGRPKRRAEWTKRFRELQAKRFKIPVSVMKERRLVYAV